MKAVLVIDNSGDFPRIEIERHDNAFTVAAYVSREFIENAKPGDFVHYNAHMSERIFIMLGEQWPIHQ